MSHHVLEAPPAGRSRSASKVSDLIGRFNNCKGVVIEPEHGAMQGDDPNRVSATCWFDEKQWLRTQEETVLTPEDFRLAAKFCKKMAKTFQKRKGDPNNVYFIRFIKEDEHINTFCGQSEELEASQTALSGQHVIVTRGHLVNSVPKPKINDNGMLNQYVVNVSDVPLLYETLGESFSVKHGWAYFGLNKVEAFELPSGASIWAPWGSRQNVQSGYILHRLDNSEVYLCEPDGFISYHPTPE